MNTPESYHIADWLGDIDYINPLYKEKRPLPSPRSLRPNFEKFLSRVPQAESQLQILIPQLVQDHSAESLSVMDAWLRGFVEDYRDAYLLEMKARGLDFSGKDKFQEPGAVFTETTPLLRSVLTDCFIYYSDCLRRKLPKLEWCVCSGKAGYWRQTGFPGLIGPYPDFTVCGGDLQPWFLHVPGYYRGIESELPSYRTGFDFRVNRASS